MKRAFFLVPITRDVGLTSVTLGLLRALDRCGLRVAFFKPVGQQPGHEPECSTHFVRATCALSPATPITFPRAESLMASGHADRLFDEVIRGFHESSPEADLVVVEGLVPTPERLLANSLNAELIRALDAEVIFVGLADALPQARLREQIELATQTYVRGDISRVAGCILNRLRPHEKEPVEGAVVRARAAYAEALPVGPKLIGIVPERDDLAQCRTRDIARHLAAEVVVPGEIDRRRVKKIHLVARTVPNIMHTLRPGNVLVTPADRDDVLLAASMAAVKGVPLAGLVLTGDTPLDGAVFTLCSPGLSSGLPVLRVKTNSYETARCLDGMSTQVPSDDLERIRRTMDFIAEHVDSAWIEERCRRPIEPRQSPAAFCHSLTERARAIDARIVLPEGEEPRTVRAAALCAERGIARCILLGDPRKIREVAGAEEIPLPRGVEIVDADAVRANYVEPMVRLRRHKQLSAQAAADQLEDNVVLGTMMLALGEVDGLVSGATHSSASTVRPALQLIKTRPGVDAVSSVFFMCLPDQVVVYGDCAVVPEPDARTLAEIAIQSADSAERFGIPARVAMISYSTGRSGSGADVDKVREATRIARERRPDLLIDGPLQYDAAAIPDVAARKAPDSPVAGRATVFVFPDLNTGNTTYKAVQRSANAVSIGPMLQGLRRPVNDLSRGALVEDIVYTIALTAVQSAQA